MVAIKKLYVGCKKPFKRLWISSLTAESIRNGFNHLLPAAEKDNMFSAGITRAKIDWLWGMNMTRLYTKHFGALCSVGRVQTAVVNMIAERDNEIDHFTKKPYFKLKLDNGAEWFDDERESFPTRAEAESVKAKCENSPCKVVFVNAKQKKENRPLLFSLTSLQVEANDKLGFSAATTLAVMQSLYEKKLLTYPRTDSNYLTEDMAQVCSANGTVFAGKNCGSIIEERVSMLRVMNEAADDVLAAGLTIDSRIINDSKVSDHHAIIPTENIGGAASMELSANEKAILDMVITRFLAALSPQYEYTETDYVFEVSGERFKCRTKAPRVLGWKRFYTDNDEENSASLNFSEGFSFEAKNLTISECETQPPKLCYRLYGRIGGFFMTLAEFVDILDPDAPVTIAVCVDDHIYSPISDESCSITIMLRNIAVTLRGLWEQDFTPMISRALQPVIIMERTFVRSWHRKSTVI